VMGELPRFDRAQGQWEPCHLAECALVRPVKRRVPDCVNKASLVSMMTTLSAVQFIFIALPGHCRGRF
jgi:hypothetical protein